MDFWSNDQIALLKTTYEVQDFFSLATGNRNAIAIGKHQIAAIVILCNVFLIDDMRLVALYESVTFKHALVLAKIV